ncbi:hypothetical protein [Mycobacterium sp. DL440]|uniref:hypothetical protein n=1 Tax=Mycobacterium sp. DL440 TaxID=2675523 RepID=UPI00141F1872|nr:hypothetical protein [Mycobacterium sp. DL440]
MSGARDEFASAAHAFARLVQDPASMADLAGRDLGSDPAAAVDALVSRALTGRADLPRGFSVT